MDKPTTTSLCAPNPHLTCFGCCPPIRPPHYDPLDHVRILRREFRENRQQMREVGPRFKPIVGYSCWALGFLDAKGRRVGCLLHPLQNQGKDLRHLIDYGNKCARELCRPARFFARLPEAGRRFWLELAACFHSFLYSSRRANPLFHLLLWGRGVLEPLRRDALARHESATELIYRFPFLLSREWNPAAVRWVFRAVLQEVLQSPMGPASREGARAEGSILAANQRIEEACRNVLGRCSEFLGDLGPMRESGAIRPEPGTQENQSGIVRPSLHPSNPAFAKGGMSFTHQLDLPEDLKDFLRLTLGWQKASPNAGDWVKESMAAWTREWFSNLSRAPAA